VVKLTARGRDASTVAGRVFADLERRWEAKLGPRRMDQFRRMLLELTVPNA
jgi:DNA-binding MarR family transcriptional regulator